MIAGAGVAATVVYRNFRKTNTRYGIIGTVGQLVLLAIAAQLGGVIVAFTTIGFFFTAMLARPVYVNAKR